MYAKRMVVKSHLQLQLMDARVMDGTSPGQCRLLPHYSQILKVLQAIIRDHIPHPGYAFPVLGHTILQNHIMSCSSQFWSVTLENNRHPWGALNHPFVWFISQMIWSPSRVSQGATIWMISVSFARISASPPVAITFMFSPNSCRTRITIPSTNPTYPYNKPDCIECTVFLPITDGGFCKA